jgi:hypothetical protein
MIRLPLEYFSYGTQRPAIVVTWNQDNGTVDLSVELEPGEAVPNRKIPDLPSGDEPTQDQMGRLDEIVEVLTEQLDAARNLRDIDRGLTPDEARALASMLIHFANEAERRR